MVLMMETPVRNNILKFRPRPTPRKPRMGTYPLWSMRKHACRIDCSIVNVAAEGWNVVFQFNALWFSNHRFETWEEAIAAADDKHAELERSGWIAQTESLRSLP